MFERKRRKLSLKGTGSFTLLGGESVVVVVASGTALPSSSTFYSTSLTASFSDKISSFMFEKGLLQRSDELDQSEYYLHQTYVTL